MAQNISKTHFIILGLMKASTLLWHCDSMTQNFMNVLNHNYLKNSWLFLVEKICWVHFKVMDKKMKLINYNESRVSPMCLIRIHTYDWNQLAPYLWRDVNHLHMYLSLCLTSSYENQPFVLYRSFLSEALVVRKAVWTSEGLARA